MVTFPETEPDVTCPMIPVPEDVLLMVKYPPVVKTPDVKSKVSVIVVAADNVAPAELFTVNEAKLLVPANVWASVAFKTSVEPAAPVIVPVCDMLFERVRVVAAVMVRVLPVPIVRGPKNVTFPPVENVVEPAEFKRINSLSDPKLVGEPPVPS